MRKSPIPDTSKGRNAAVHGHPAMTGVNQPAPEFAEERAFRLY